MKLIFFLCLKNSNKLLIAQHQYSNLLLYLIKAILIKISDVNTILLIYKVEYRHFIQK